MILKGSFIKGYYLAYKLCFNNMRFYNRTQEIKMLQLNLNQLS